MPPPDDSKKQSPILQFALSLDVSSNSLSYITNMPILQVLALVQTIAQNQERDALRQQIEAELKSTRKSKSA